jgi:hypothetical protein
MRSSLNLTKERNESRTNCLHAQKRSFGREVAMTEALTEP